MTPEMFQVGRVRVHLVSDGTFWTDGGTAFGVVPRVLWEKVAEPDEMHRIPMRLRCLLVETSDGLLLVDTGYGDKLPTKQRAILNLRGDFRLIGDLATLGHRPEDVRFVVNTHLHGDHCGGNTVLSPNGQIRPAFPNATYLVQRLELADATYPNERTRNTYFGDNFLPLAAGSDSSAPSLRVLSGDTQLTPEVRTMVTPGHTRAHQVVIIESAGETAAFLADLSGWAVGLEKLAWVPAFDVEPLVSIETKRSVRDWALRHDALLFFQHDAHLGAGRLTRDGDEWRVERVSPVPG